MPELPEVETVKNGLLKKIKGRKIITCRVLWPGIIAMPDVDTFVKNISSEIIEDLDRRGKFIIIKLTNYLLISHLRMEGKYFIKDKEEELSKHDHVIFTLDNNKELRYNDTRKFGKMYLVEKDKLDTTPIKDLGLEPWDKNLNEDYLKEKLNKKKAIKTLLLDQSIIAGIGNIYADEILYLSKINPEQNGCNLTKKNLTDIIKNTRYVLEESIKLGGSTIHTYSSVDGVTGMFQQQLLVHEKKECPKNHRVEKIVVNGRGTYYCPKCQKH